MRALVFVPAVTLALLAPAFVQADGSRDDLRFEASVSRDRVEIGQTVTLTVTVGAVSDGGAANLSLPRPDGFEIVSTSQRTNMNVVMDRGGVRTERSTTHTLVLRATKTGVRTIPPAEMKRHGRLHETAPLEVTVLPSGQLRSGRPAPRDQGQGGGRMPSLFDEEVDVFDLIDRLQRQMEGDVGRLQQRMETDLFDRAEELERQASLRDDVFLEVSVDKTEVWLGEQVTAEILLYSRYDIAGFPSPPTMPRMEGFWQEDIERPSTLQGRLVNVRGVPYRAFLLRRMALFPTRAGELIIDPAEAQVETALGIIRRGRTLHVRSEPVTIDVRPLPAEGRPEGFVAGNVGEWNLDASLSRETARVGEPLTLALEVRGEANLHAVEVPRIEAPEGLRVYDPAMAHEPSIRRNKFGGEKTVRWVLVPAKAGSVMLPPLELHFFDPEDGRYRSRRVGPLVIEVLPAVAGQSRDDAGSTRLAARARASGVDVMVPVRFGVPATLTRPPPHRSPLFLGLVGSAGVALLLLGAAGLIRRRPLAGGGSSRRGRELAKANGRLKAARAQNGGAAVDEAVAALREYLRDRWGLKSQALSREGLRRGLADAGCSSELADHVCELLERGEELRYAPIGVDEQAVAGLLRGIGDALGRFAGLEAERSGS